MEELDLAIQPTEEKKDCCAPVASCGTAEDDKRPCYPCMTFNDKHAELFKSKYGQCSVGDEYEMTVKLKVTGTRDQKWGKAIEFDVLSIIGDVVEEEGGEEESEKKPVKAKKPKVDASKLGSY